VSATHAVDEIDQIKAAFMSVEPPSARQPRAEILNSWQRSRAALGTPTDLHEIPQVSVDLLDSALLDTFEAPLQRFADTLDGTGLGLLLADSCGRILQRWGDRSAQLHYDRVGTMRGSVLAEDAVGTNGVGTVVATGNRVQISGAEHFADFYSGAVCTGAPVTHPVTGRLLAVVTLSCDITPRSELLPPLLQSAVLQLEEHVLDVEQPASRRMMAAFLKLSRTRGEPVLGLGPDGLLVQNSRASRLSASELDRITSICESQTSEGSRRVAAEGVHIEVTSLERNNHVVVVLDHREASRSQGPPRAVAANRLVGRSPDWFAAVRAVDMERHAGSPVIIAGEHSVGKLSLALGSPYSRLKEMDGLERNAYLDAAESHVLGSQEWLWRLSAKLNSGKRVTIRGVESLGSHAQAGLRSLLEQASCESPVMLTMTPDQRADAESLALRLGGRCVWVPALRDRVADLPALWDAFTESITPARRLVVRADAMAILRAHSWPGNLAELQSVVRTLVTAPPRGPVSPQHLPDRVRGSGGSLTLIERVEREAIRQALAEAEGNRAQAAEILGVSRATVYRKVKTYHL